VNEAHIARMYNYWLGGKDHFAADRAARDATIAVYPGIQLSTRPPCGAGRQEIDCANAYPSRDHHF